MIERPGGNIRWASRFFPGHINDRSAWCEWSLIPLILRAPNHARGSKSVAHCLDGQYRFDCRFNSRHSHEYCSDGRIINVIVDPAGSDCGAQPLPAPLTFNMKKEVTGMGTKLGTWITLRPIHKDGKLPAGAMSLNFIRAPMNVGKKAGMLVAPPAAERCYRYGMP